MRGFVVVCALVCGSVIAQEKTRVAAVPKKPTASSIWKSLGKSRGGRAIEGLKSGTGEFKVLIVASLNGYDPTATKLVENAAAQVVRDSAIIGGFRSVVVRNPNPDGVALRRTANADGVRIATSFAKNAANREPETSFMIRLLRDYKPHRVIHITTGSSSDALVLHNETGRDIATDFASWMNAKTRNARRFSPVGSMEQFVGESAEIITLVLPKAQPATDAWKKYGDGLLAVLAPSEPVEDWPPPTAWNEKDFQPAKVLRSGQATEVKPKK